MIKKLLLVVFLLSVCTGCSVRFGPPYIGVLNGSHSIVRFDGSSKIPVVDVSEDLRLQYRRNSATLWLTKEDEYIGRDTIQLWVETHDKAVRPSSILCGSEIDKCRDNDDWIPEEVVDGKNVEYKIYLARHGGDFNSGVIKYQYAYFWQRPEGWTRVRVNYIEPLPEKWRTVSWNEDTQWGTFLEDFKKRARASFTMRLP